MKVRALMLEHSIGNIFLYSVSLNLLSVVLLVNNCSPSIPCRFYHFFYSVESLLSVYVELALRPLSETQERIKFVSV